MFNFVYVVLLNVVCAYRNMAVRTWRESCFVARGLADMCRFAVLSGWRTLARYDKEGNVYPDLIALAPEFTGLAAAMLRTASSPAQRAIALNEARDYCHSQMWSGVAASNNGHAGGTRRYEDAKRRLACIPAV